MPSACRLEYQCRNFEGSHSDHRPSAAMECSQVYWWLLRLLESTAEVCSLRSHGLSSLSLVPWSSLLTQPTWTLPGGGITLRSGCDVHLIPGLGDHARCAVFGTDSFRPQHNDLSGKVLSGTTIFSFSPQGRLKVLDIFHYCHQGHRKNSGCLTQNFPLTRELMLLILWPLSLPNSGLESPPRNPNMNQSKACGLHFLSFYLTIRSNSRRKRYRVEKGSWTLWKIIYKNGHYYSPSCFLAMWHWSPSIEMWGYLSLPLESGLTWWIALTNKMQQTWCHVISDCKPQKVLCVSVLFTGTLPPPYEWAQVRGTHWKIETSWSLWGHPRPASQPSSQSQT